MNKVVILGGGIAAIEAAIFYKKEGFEVELISERDYLFIYPISIWIPLGTTSFEYASMPLGKLAQRHGFIFTKDSVVEISGEQKSVTLQNSGIRKAPHLVIAIGSGKMKHDGLENTLSICAAPEQSLMLKTRIDEIIAKGSGKIALGFGGNPKDSSGVRGGPGFELLFNLHNHLVGKGVRDRFELTFFAPMPQPGARMGTKALAMMAKMFTRDKIGTRYGKKISRFTSEGVVFEDKSVLEADLTMFIPAGDGHPIVKASDLPQNDAGFIRINDYCEIEGIEGWYAIGDVAALQGPDWKAKQGHIAEVMARNCAHNHAISLGLKKGEPKGYQEHLTILCVMDMGDGAGFVYRNDAKALLIPMPIIGHWMKIAWGWYYKWTKMRFIPRIPGL
ncbi:MAG TPA: FAD-dependent oxidoreductase [Sulfuricurvum sp.]|nr:MAG: sulfide:quinone reductase [Campylobacterales bacterium 16-40-21]OZA03801.1 MAG: sulfide:quinone reductase [Sulfuricurvum sp. 17-40-25]HQS65681.1 FAD-dependent oxidoreductase [Sulfuricurvum sp.]HQT37342.1 FAD-dependent oxidoreductase [Sulfuricurvum sp.]